MFSCGEMIEWERKGERRVFSWGEENGGGRVFSSSPPFKRKKFSPQFRKKLERKVGREWVWCEITNIPSPLFINFASFCLIYFFGKCYWLTTAASFFFLVFHFHYTTLVASLFLSSFLLFFFPIKHTFFLLVFFFFLDVLFVVLVCKFEVIKKINFYKLFKSCFLCTRGMKVNLYKLHFLILSVFYLSTFPLSKLNTWREN